MKSRSHSRLIFVVVGVLTLAITVSAIFSLAQSGLPLDPLTLSAMPLDPVRDVTRRIPHPACPDCFKVAGIDYGIFEEVPGTGMIYLRDLPDPAPLGPGEVRPEFDEGGLPMWYIGQQGFVGPTDEEPVFPDLSLSKIALLRIKARHEALIFSIPGVNGFGIGGQGFFVMLNPVSIANVALIPLALEGVPVEIELVSGHVLTSHDFDTYRPIPIGIGIEGFRGRGTLGPHIVRGDTPDGTPCCQIWSLTAGHLVKRLGDPPVSPGSSQSRIFQGPGSGFLWGFVVQGFQQTPCDTPQDRFCDRPEAPVNLTFQRPEVAAIAHGNPSHTDPPRDSTFRPMGLEPMRRMQYKHSDCVHGPTGEVMVASINTSIKVWSASNDAPKGPVIGVGVSFVAGDFETTLFGPVARNFKFCCMERVSLERQAKRGDSGSLAAWNERRHVMGVVFGADVTRDAQGNDVLLRTEYYVRAGDIQIAFKSAGTQFANYWGTSDSSFYWRPSVTQYDQTAGACNPL